MPSYYPVLQYAESRFRCASACTGLCDARQRARPAALDNSAAMQEILALRQEEARLLGHANFAELSLVPKMARLPNR